MNSHERDHLDYVYEKAKDFSSLAELLDQDPKRSSAIKKILAEIHGEYSYKLVGSIAKFLDQTFLRLYNGIEATYDLEKSLDVLKKEYHLILVPNHQSHADYITMQYILYKDFTLPVFIAGGVNLNIFPLGAIFRRCGAFFIRRKFDDDLYKKTFQGYIYYLLKSEKIVEFFFEGGRTRTGKLLPPKYGLFSMLLDAHSRFHEPKKPLMFLPVSIAHEIIPEEKALAKESWGGRKKKESASELLKVLKIFTKKMGTIHVNFSNPLIVHDTKDLKKDTQDIALECFKRVAASMPVTPTSLLALVMLDEATAALSWSEISSKAQKVRDFCLDQNIPITLNLKGHELEASLKLSLDILLNNNRVEIIKKPALEKVYYVVIESSRTFLLYHKNMIIHHFLVAQSFNLALKKLMKGEISSKHSLLRFLIMRREELKYEFYLPTMKEMTNQGLQIINHACGVELEQLTDALQMSLNQHNEMRRYMAPFSNTFGYIYESYYISATTLTKLKEVTPLNDFLKVAKEIFDLEIHHGRLVRFPESFSVQVLKTSLKYFQQKNVIHFENDCIEVKDRQRLSRLIDGFVEAINDQIYLSLKDHAL